MESEPMGGYPSVVRTDNGKIEEKTLESRGFATNIVSINNIMDSKKKENLFLAFGSDEEEGVNYAIENMFTNSPNVYDDFGYAGTGKEK